MVSIKKNTKGELKEATGLRTRKTSIYTPGQNETLKSVVLNSLPLWTVSDVFI